MTDYLVEITLSQQSHELISKLSKLSPDLGKSVKNIGVNAVKGATNLAQDGYRSKVPVDTEALRDRFIKTSYSSSDTTGTVYVPAAVHINSRGIKQPASSLSELLQIGTQDGKELKRTRDSLPLGNYGGEKARTPTANWQDKAFNAFIHPAKLGAFLSKTDFTKKL